MSRLIRELLDQEHGCWNAICLTAGLRTAVRDLDPDLVIVDGSDFPLSGADQPANYPLGRLVVVGPEPDGAYRAAALGAGAGAWIARDDVGEQLSAEMRRALGCSHAIF